MLTIRKVVTVAAAALALAACQPDGQNTATPAPTATTCPDDGLGDPDGGHFTRAQSLWRGVDEAKDEARRERAAGHIAEAERLEAQAKDFARWADEEAAISRAKEDACSGIR